MTPGFQTVLTARDADRRELFVGAGNRLGTAEQNIEKDFWVCWTLDALFNGLDADSPRLLFKGGTSLSKGYGLIERFSEVYFSGIPLLPPRGNEYIRRAIKIESGAKSALDPHSPLIVKPYVGNDLPDLDLSVPNVTTVDASRTLLDKVVILHGLRRWWDSRNELKGGGQRVSRHYYDIYRLLASEPTRLAIGDRGLAADCVRHARMFFNRPDFDLASAVRGSFALSPGDGMVADLRRDYQAMSGMIFGAVPPIDDVLAAVTGLEETLNSKP
jgi:hypothetical protein